VDRRDWLILVLGFILWGVTLSAAYNAGEESGYLEYEEEENVYSCPVFREPVDT
jgi:hypothetical protein